MIKKIPLVLFTLFIILLSLVMFYSYSNDNNLATKDNFIQVK